MTGSERFWPLAKSRKGFCCAFVAKFVVLMFETDKAGCVYMKDLSLCVIAPVEFRRNLCLFSAF